MKKSISEESKFTNSLIHESSPYLLQHAHNPVNWLAWNEETLQKAKDENKMLIISIGYSACHWCHVMEHESFEDKLVAGLMNDHFIAIKVDREERPDIDDVYMAACQLSNQRGCGWPLNAFALPDGRPVWAGTYYPKDQWINILDQFISLQQTQSPKLEESAEYLTKGIKSYDTIKSNDKVVDFDLKDLHLIASDFMGHIDFEHGGRKGQPKFPMPNNYQFLLKYHKLTGDPRALEAVTTTLDRMAYGGLYDQIGGGFARYSVDGIWLAPHFEKMLYDNSQLVSLYAQAYKFTKNDLYLKVVNQTLSFIDRELTDHSTGGFYSALDADSEGVEGKFYVWTKSEIEFILGKNKNAAIFCDYFDVTEEGNWEENNILYHRQDTNIAEKYQISVNELHSILDSAISLLFEAREKRVRPGLDDKILTSWNAMMLQAYIEAYTASGHQSYLDIALINAHFICNKLMATDSRLNRNFKHNKATINGFLDDYAHVIQAFIILYQATLDEVWLNKSVKLLEYTLVHFFDQETGMFYYTSDLDPPLIVRKMELQDNVIPSSNSVMAINLFKLSVICDQPEYLNTAKRMMGNIVEQIKQSRQPSFYSNWCQLHADLAAPPYEIAITGPDALAKSLLLQKEYLPNGIIIGSAAKSDLSILKDKWSEDKTQIFVCQDKVCKQPVTEVADALKQIQ